MRPHLGVIFAIVCFSIGALGDDGPQFPAINHIEASSTSSTNAPSGPTFGNFACGPDASMFFRYFPLGKEAGSSVPIAKIAPDGQFSTIPLRFPDPHAALELYQFTIAADNSLFAIVRSTEIIDNVRVDHGTFLAKFGRDGQFLSRIPLEMHIIPSMLVPLPSGEIFAGGVRIEIAREKAIQVPFVGIFSQDGTLRRTIKISTAPVQNRPEKEGDRILATGLQNGIARLGGDGNIYVVLATSPLKVEVLNQAGDLVREFTPPSPLRNASHAFTFLSQTKLLMGIVGEDAVAPQESPMKTKTVLWVVYDAQTGAPLRAYELPKYSGVPACWEDGKQLQVLTPDKSTGEFKMLTFDVP